MKLALTQTESRSALFAKVQQYLSAEGLKVVAQDTDRPWGGFFVIDESQARDFARLYFPEFNFSALQLTQKLSPKILMVQPANRLSWQYHHRRAEIWKLIAGTAGVVISSTDEQGPVQKLEVGQVVKLPQGQRHRLVGTEGWGVVAEIWQHTDEKNPSDEQDIVRLQDDFGR